MTREEALLVQAHTPITLQFSPLPDPRFLGLRGRCPLLAWNGRQAVCTVYAVRPFACRRFGCFRPDPDTEPFENEPINLAEARIGCANLSDRLKNRAVRRAYAKMQRKAQRWALQHGWNEQMTGRQVGSNVIFYHATPVPQ